MIDFSLRSAQWPGSRGLNSAGQLLPLLQTKRLVSMATQTAIRIARSAFDRSTFIFFLPFGRGAGSLFNIG